MQMPRILQAAIALMAAAAISVMLAACGSQSEKPSQAASSEAAQSESAGAAQSASAQAQANDSTEVARLIEEAERYYHGTPGNADADFEKAASLYEQAAALGSPYGMFMRGTLFLMADDGNAEQAFANYEEWTQKAYDTALDMPADSNDANLALGLLLTQTSDRQSAIPYLEQAVQGEKPYSVLAMVGLADLYEKDGDIQQAAAWYEQAIDEGCTRVIPELALMYSSANNQQQAIAWYTKAIEAGYKSWYGLGTAYVLAGDYDNAFRAYQQGYDEGINVCAYGLGNIYFAQKDVQNALEYYQQYLNGREIENPENYTDFNERHIREYVQAMLDNGLTDEATVAQYLGEGFLES